MKIDRIRMDIDKKLAGVIPSVQWDDNTRFLHINILNGAKAFDLTGYSVKVAGLKPDGTSFLNDVRIINAKEGFIEVVLTEQMNAAAGSVRCDIKIYSARGVLSTQPFILDVEPSVTTKSITSSNEFMSLTEALNRVGDMDNKFASLTSETVARATEEEIKKQIASGGMTHMTIADGSIGKRKLDPNLKWSNRDISDISIQKIDEIITKTEKGLNLYDKNTMYEQGHWTDGGTWNPSESWYSTGYIEVKPSTTYIKSGRRKLPDGSISLVNGEPIAFFDANKNYIAGSATRLNCFTTPANCKYINTLVSRPGYQPEDERYMQYPYGVARDILVIVEGSVLPDTYVKYSTHSYSLKGLELDGDNLKPGIIAGEHVAPDSGIGSVYAGRGIPPATAVLWFIPPASKKLGFIKDNLVICVDGRYATPFAHSMENAGSAKGWFNYLQGNTPTEESLTVESDWIIGKPGFNLYSNMQNQYGIKPSEFTSNDITIMCRCRVPAVLTAPWNTNSSPISLGSDPYYAGYYLKPLFRGINSNVWSINSRPVEVMESWVTGMLAGKDIILTMRKIDNTVEMFINGIPCGTHEHTPKHADTWKVSTNFNIHVGGLGDIGSVLVYDRALTDEELQHNIQTEIGLRGAVSSLTVVKPGGGF